MPPIAEAIHYLRRAARLAFGPGIRPWVIVPILFNSLLFGSAYWFTGSWLTGLLGALTAGWALEGWLAFLNPVIGLFTGLLQLLIWVLLLALMASVFTYVVQLVAAPFMGFLAAQVDNRVAPPLGFPAQPEESIPSMIWRTLKRELRKTWYWLWRAVLLLILVGILSFIPVVNLLAPVIWFIWSGWMLAIQYIDYGADTRLVSFEEMLGQLRQQRILVTALGSLILALTMLPLVNLVIMPVAVVAGTLFWLEKGSVRPAPAPVRTPAPAAHVG
ncbi:cysZ family protein [Isoalcanivorax pacificus W11-5]|uniref:CysZ family protein n=1 Tax=Isoalcanivorax pacificus W11-5 TaxID=391936 RepID=A0A0B4XMC1_9GAMM|nr:sulfate transporter CysZ [Isoalcanivorax pacificus]AJD47713.1 cysZ family protein [Isoalcanivorax pacificus W11-5]